MSVECGQFSRVAARLLFDSCAMHSFCEALTSVFTAFLYIFGYFLLPIGILVCLMFFFYFYSTLNLLDD